MKPETPKPLEIPENWQRCIIQFPAGPHQMGFLNIAALVMQSGSMAETDTVKNRLIFRSGEGPEEMLKEFLQGFQAKNPNIQITFE